MNIFNFTKGKKEKRKKEKTQVSISSGFTLVETLVAIAILMIAIAGPLTVAEKGLSASIYARDQLIASYLAQDTMESIKNIVDSNELAGNPWLSSLSNYSCTSSSNNPTSFCTINTTSNPLTIDMCAVGACLPLNLSSSGYVQGGTSPVTPFTRYFYIQTFNVGGGTNNAANVVVNVTWPGDVIGGGGVDLEDTMFDTPLQ
jgi:prepilin-type N-terminal cleavage/methylation domain-containing protein